MKTSWQKIILFSLYFFLTTALPLFSFTKFAPEIFDFVSLIVMGIIFMGLIGRYEWKLMPKDSVKILIWFLSPIIILTYNFFYFGKDIFLNLLWMDGAAIIISFIIVGMLTDTKRDFINSNISKENLNKFKTPFLHSYWQKKYIHSRFSSIENFISTPIVIIVGLVILVRAVFPFLPYPESIRFLITFTISLITNVLAFYKAEFSKYEP